MTSSWLDNINVETRGRKQEHIYELEKISQNSEVPGLEPDFRKQKSSKKQLASILFHKNTACNQTRNMPKQVQN